LRVDGRFLLLLGCFLLSGMAGLVYQTAWTQQFALVFGASELAVVAVLAAYMAGLTLGAAAAARWVESVRRPVLAYALLEAGVALAALAVPAALRLADRLQVAWLGSGTALADGGSLATVAFHLAASFVILAVPTGLMGATLPLLARSAVARDEELGGRVGTLYTVNTLGAAAGAVLGGFVLLPALGLGRTVWVGVALNAAACVLAVPLFASAPAAAERGERPTVPLANVHVLPLLAAGSAIAFLYEVAWTRLLTFLLGGSIYAFATMLGTFLMGIALGAGAAARLARTEQGARRAFVLAQIGTALLSLAAFRLLDALPALAARLAAEGVGRMTAGALLAALVLLPGSICIGSAFPLAVRMLATQAEQAGPASARAFAWSTVGAVVGAVGGGLFVLPALRFDGTARALAVAGVLLGLAALGGARPRPRLLGALSVVALLACVLLPVRTPWTLLGRSTLAGEWTGDVVFWAVGRGSTVMVFDTGGEWRLASNGLPESAITPPGARVNRYGTAHWLALLAVAARPEARSLMVVGLGAGKTVEEVPPSVEEIHVVELEEEIVRANRALSARRANDPLRDPRLRLHLNDARSALLLTDRRFDAIVSQPSHPWTAGAAHLFTREFFTLVSGRLTPDGVFVLWMGQQFVDEPLLRSLLATLTAVFPHVEVYDPRPGGSFLFLAAERPLQVRESAARAIAAAPAIWAGQGITSVEDVMAVRVGDEAGVRKVAEGAPVNTDARNLLQARSPRILDRPLGIEGSDRVFAPFDPLRADASTAAGLRHVNRLIRERRLPRARRMAGALGSEFERLVGAAMLDAGEGRTAMAAEKLAALHAERPDAPEPLHALLLLRAEALVRGEDPDGVLPAAAEDPAAAAVLQGLRLSRAGRLADLRPLEEVLAAIPAYATLHETALRLRLGWRLASRDPARAREAIALLDTFMAEGATPRDALLRARLGLAAGDAPVVYASLLEIAEVASYASGFQQTAREGLDLLDAAARLAPPPANLRERLARAGRGTGEPAS
jgi:spermidine synthase